MQVVVDLEQRDVRGRDDVVEELVGRVRVEAPEGEVLDQAAPDAELDRFILVNGFFILLIAYKWLDVGVPYCPGERQALPIV